MSEHQDFWDSYFKGNSDAPEYRKDIPAPEPTAEPVEMAEPAAAYPVETEDVFPMEETRIVPSEELPPEPEDGATIVVSRPERETERKVIAAEDEEYGDTGPQNFHVNFDFEGEYRDASKPMPLTVRREKRSGLVGGLLYGIFVICIGIVAGCILWMCATDVLALGHKDSEVKVTIPASIFYDGTVTVKNEEDEAIGERDASLADINQLAEIMYDSGLIKYRKLFSLYCKFSHADQKVGSGTYVLNTKYDYRALVYGVMPSSSMREEVSVMIPEGFTLKRAFARLEEYGICSMDELWDTAANYAFEDEYSFLKGIPAKGDQFRLEGYLFPDTYYFYTGDDPVRVIKKFLNNFEVKFEETYIERAQEMGRSISDIIIIASMIEREASSYEGERDQIASVIYNRINSSNFYCLQVDATIIYGMSRNNDEDLELSTDYESPYNTYLYGGLPPGPICNPGEDSIRAALYPESTNYYYYALNKGDGTVKWHEFFTNYDSFLRFINSDDYGG